MTTRPAAGTFSLRLTLGRGGRWSAAVAELPEVTAVDRSLSGAERRARAKISKALGTTETLDLAVSISTGDQALDRQCARARRLQERADALSERSRKIAEAAAQQLVHELGASTRDAGALLSKSASWVSSKTATTTPPIE